MKGEFEKSLMTSVEVSFVINNILNALSDVVNVLGGNTTDGDSSVFGHIDVMLFDHGFRLFQGEAGEREHTNLSSNMRPVSLSADLLERVTKSLSHGENSIANGDEFSLPLVSHLNVVQKDGSDSGTMLGRRRVVSSDDNFELG